MGKDDATQNEIEQAAINANAHDFITNLPKVCKNKTKKPFIDFVFDYFYIYEYLPRIGSNSNKLLSMEGLAFLTKHLRRPRTHKVSMSQKGIVV